MYWQPGRPTYRLLDVILHGENREALMGNPHHWRLPLWARGLTAGFALVLALILASCTSTVTVTSEQGNGSVTPTTAAAATATTASSTGSGGGGCSSQSGFSGAGAATAGSGFDDVTFPAHSVSTSITASHGGDGRFTI